MQPQRSNLLSRLLWLVVILATLGVIVYIFEKAAPAVPFPSTSSASDLSASTSAFVSLLPVPYSSLEIRAPHGAIDAMIASTSDQQALGLGQRDSLPANDGMLFPFASPGRYGFWMKDMRFPLDMVWIGPDKRVVAVSADVSPATYPLVLFPPSDVSYVLELNADSALKFGIATDTELFF